ncbi:hypothetical protein EDC04DRAFT_2830257 [Pisolithus marmoratus]|nr:hypothetical protein EDC04DRAFT_2830257 [Pisolithus marmoratus]
MNNRLLPGQYLITCLENDDHLGLSHFVNPLPDPSPAEVILLPQGVVPPQFTVVPVDVGGTDTYVIVVENLTIRGRDDRAFAFGNEPAEVWCIRYSESHNAYTITRREEPSVWTALREEPEHPGQILICPLVCMPQSIPPQFHSSQLFRFERVPRE